MFKLLGVCELWEFCVKIAKVARIIGILFYAVKFMYNFLLQKVERATFWATFSQTHLVT
jgi:hypothetical protein